MNLSILLICLTLGTLASAAELLQPIPLHDKDHPANFDPHYQNRSEWESRADFLRRQVLVSQGLWPEPTKVPLNPVIHGKIQRDGYIIEKVFFTSLPGHYVT